MRYLSVCSGIEAATCAWHSIGWEPVAFSEIEKFPSAVLTHHYPNIPNLGDMTKIAAMIRASTVAAPDVLVGGTPCQAFSIAGMRQSLDDARGQLTLSFVDLANAIDSARLVQRKPASIVVWENVPGVLSTADNAFGCFLGALAGEDSPLIAPGGKWANAGCVYGAQRNIAWRTLDAQYFGVAQRRRRVFVVASARDGFDPAAVLFEFDGLRRDIAPSRETGETITNPVAPCLTSSGKGVERGDDARMRAGNHDKSYANSGHPPVICFDTTQITSPSNHSNPKAGAPCYTLAKGMHAPAIAFDSRQDPVSSFDVFGALGGSSPQAQAICVTGSITHTLKAEGFDASEDGTGRGTPIVTVPTLTSNGDAHSGFRDENGLVIAFAKNQRDEVRTMEVAGALAAEPGMKQQTYLACFKGGQGSKAFGIGYSESLSPTLTAADSGSQLAPTLMQGAQVRRLMPIECERLQAFPDFYTLIPIRKLSKKRAATIIALDRADEMTIIGNDYWLLAADGPRYKALGNSMCVKNMRWIGERIQAHIAQIENKDAA